jgi:hypothetical protein
MPSGIFPVPEFRPVPARARRRLAVGIRTRRRRGRLDEQLARGTEPATSAELTQRAAQLRSRAERTRVANTLVQALGDARGPNLGAFTVKRRRQHAAIREHAHELLALVARLRDDQPVAVQGAAMSARLVDDRSGPLHRGGGQHLRHEIRAARFALDATGTTAEHLAEAA